MNNDDKKLLKSYGIDKYSLMIISINTILIAFTQTIIAISNNYLHPPFKINDYLIWAITVALVIIGVITNKRTLPKLRKTRENISNKHQKR